MRKNKQEVRDGNRTRLAGSRVQRLRPLAHDFHFRMSVANWSKHSQRTSSIIPELKQSILVARGKRRGERRACACKLYQYLLLLIHSPPVSILVAIEVRYRNSNQFWLLFWSASYKFKRRREIFTPTYLVSCYYLHQILYST